MPGYKIIWVWPFIPLIPLKPRFLPLFQPFVDMGGAVVAGLKPGVAAEQLALSSLATSPSSTDSDADDDSDTDSSDAAVQFQTVARTRFAGNDLVTPQQWSDPQGDTPARQYRAAFLPEQWGVAADEATAPALSRAHSDNWHHVHVQTMHNALIGSYIDRISAAIVSAWRQWQRSATITGIAINGPTASGGRLVGPPLEPLILAKGPKKTPMERKYTRVIANVIGTAWLEFTQTVLVPGLPFYPAFAAVSSPVGPPSPNVPVPFAALTQVPFPISSFVTKQAMVAQLADPRAPLHKELFDAIGYAFEICYGIWRIKTKVTNVIGTGPVPTFAPPVVPVGPVAGGVGTMAPGGLV
jgi:hypothetical protein